MRVEGRREEPGRNRTGRRCSKRRVSTSRALPPRRPDPRPPAASMYGWRGGSAASSPGAQVRVEAAALEGRPVLFAVFYPRGERSRDSQCRRSECLPSRRSWASSSRASSSARCSSGGTTGSVGSTFAAAQSWPPSASGTVARLDPPRSLHANGGNDSAAHARRRDVAVRRRPHVRWVRRHRGVRAPALARQPRVVEPPGRREVRDPLVGQDVLVGVLVGLVGASVWVGYFAVAHALGARPAPTVDARGMLTLTLGQVLGRSADAVSFSAFGASGGLVMLPMAKAVVRRRWAAYVCMAVIGAFAWDRRSARPIRCWPWRSWPPPSLPGPGRPTATAWSPPVSPRGRWWSAAHR